MTNAAAAKYIDGLLDVRCRDGSPNALTRRANQAHIDIIARIIRPAPEDGSGRFRFFSKNSKIGFDLPNRVRSIFDKV
jgi:hypothetical protein